MPSCHKLHFHLLSILFTCCGLANLFVPGTVGDYMFAKRAFLMTSELEATQRLTGGLLVLLASCLCTIPVNHHTVMSIGSGQLVAALAGSYILLTTSTFSSMMWGLPALLGLGSAYFLATAGKLSKTHGEALASDRKKAK